MCCFQCMFVISDTLLVNVFCWIFINAISRTGSIWSQRWGVMLDWVMMMTPIRRMRKMTLMTTVMPNYTNRLAVVDVLQFSESVASASLSVITVCNAKNIDQTVQLSALAYHFCHSSVHLLIAGTWRHDCLLTLQWLKYWVHFVRNSDPSCLSFQIESIDTCNRVPLHPWKYFNFFFS